MTDDLLAQAQEIQRQKLLAQAQEIQAQSQGIPGWMNEHPNIKTFTGSALEQLPIAGAALGGAGAGLAGAVEGMGPGSVPLAVYQAAAGVGLGATAGKTLESMGKHYLLGERKTAGEIIPDALKTGAAFGTMEGVAPGAGALLEKAGGKVYDLGIGKLIERGAKYGKENIGPLLRENKIYGTARNIANKTYDLAGKLTEQRNANLGDGVINIDTALAPAEKRLAELRANPADEAQAEAEQLAEKIRNYRNKSEGSPEIPGSPGVVMGKTPLTGDAPVGGQNPWLDELYGEKSQLPEDRIYSSNTSPKTEETAPTIRQSTPSGEPAKEFGAAPKSLATDPYNPTSPTLYVSPKGAPTPAVPGKPISATEASNAASFINNRILSPTFHQLEGRAPVSKESLATIAQGFRNASNEAAGEMRPDIENLNSNIGKLMTIQPAAEKMAVKEAATPLVSQVDAAMLGLPHTIPAVMAKKAAQQWNMTSYLPTTTGYGMTKLGQGLMKATPGSASSVAPAIGGMGYNVWEDIKRSIYGKEKD